jgi:hypothetical protein
LFSAYEGSSKILSLKPEAIKKFYIRRKTSTSNSSRIIVKKTDNMFNIYIYNVK